MPKGPSIYDPVRRADQNRQRRNTVRHRNVVGRYRAGVTPIGLSATPFQPEPSAKKPWTRTIGYCDGSPLGAPERWPQALKTSVRLLLSTGHPMFMWWGPELIQFYNDSFVPSFGRGKHPAAMGQRADECWADAWPVVGAQIEAVMTRGEVTVPAPEPSFPAANTCSMGCRPAADADADGGGLKHRPPRDAHGSAVRGRGRGWPARRLPRPWSRSSVLPESARPVAPET